MVAMGRREIRGGEGEPFGAKGFQRRLLIWHRHHAADFPWRRTDDPWLVLATEILLRRTRADAVATVWEEFRARFPSPSTVVHAPQELRELLWPLGLRWRVENLVLLARHLVNRHGGAIPLEREALIELPGVGNYVADAVRAFALGERALLVDSNTARIASRVFGVPCTWSSLRSPQARAVVGRLSSSAPPTPRMNLALIDLGRTVCLPGKPLCDNCPVRCYCSQRAGKLSQ
jgi:A/G-specific adenine glycosylase